MFIEEKHIRIAEQKSKPLLPYLSGLCGSGKTEVVCRKIAADWRHENNVLYVAPTIQLIEEIGDRLKKCGVESIAIHSEEKSDTSVSSRIMGQLKNSPDFGSVVLITWQSYQMLPWFPNRDNWKIVIDEIPQVDVFRELPLSKYPGFIKDEISVGDSGIDGFLLVTARHPDALKKKMSEKDKVLEVFREFYGFITSKNHEVFVLEKDWNQFDKIEDSTFRFLSMLNYRAFKNSLLLGANVESSLLVKWLRKRFGITIGPDEELESQLLYKNHSFGSRARVTYFEGVDDWSKCLRDKSNKDKVSNMALIDAAVEKFFGDRKFLVVSNKDHKTTFENGVRIPVVCHGLDSYKDFTGIYISAALNRTTRHIRLLNLLDLTGDDIRISTSVETYYQSVMRTNLRLMDSTEPVDIIVPDKASATSLREILSSQKISSIASPLTLGTKSLTRMEINRRYKEQRALQRIYPEGRQDFLRDKKISHHFGKCSLGFSFTLHKTAKDVSEKQFTTCFRDENSFIRLLRTSSKTIRRTKTEAGLINAGIYENRVDLGPDESIKREDNFIQSSFLMLDFDKGTITPEQFISMFGNKAPLEDRLPFVITNTFSTSPAAPNRFRVFVFFASPALSIQEHNATYDHMVYLLNEKGWTKEQLGLDTATRSPVLSCHLPGINIEHTTSAFFEIHNTRSREIQQFGLHPFMCMPSDTDERFSPITDDAVYGTIPQEQIDQITAEFRSMTQDRHIPFLVVGLKLGSARNQGQRLSPAAIEGILRSLATEKHYKRKVRDVMKSLRRYRHTI